MASIQKRVSKSGKISYRVQVRLKGKQPKTASFERKTDAKFWASKITTELKSKTNGPTPESETQTLGDLIDKYIAEILTRKPRSIVTQRSQLLWWREELGDQLLKDIKKPTILDRRAKLLKRSNRKGGTLSESSANRYVAALRHAYSVAINEWEWKGIAPSPIATLKKLPEPEGRSRYLNEAERGKLLEACRDSRSCFLYPIVIVALSTGARRSEILGLRWEDVNLNAGRLVFHKTKNRKRRGAPLKGYALELVRNVKKSLPDGSEFVFPNHAGTGPIDIRTPWETAVKKAGLKDFRFHDLRHTAASYLAMGGATPHEIAEVLGHKSLEMTRRYAHLSETHVDSVVERMNERMFEDET